MTFFLLLSFCAYPDCRYEEPGGPWATYEACEKYAVSIAIATRARATTRERVWIDCLPRTAP
jgi:hypothetical protein